MRSMQDDSIRRPTKAQLDAARTAAKRAAADDSRYLLPTASRWDYEHIITQVACEARHVIERSSRATLESVLRRFDACGGLSEATKRRLIQTRLSKLTKEASK